MKLVYDPCMPSDICLTWEGYVFILVICLIALLIISQIAMRCNHGKKEEEQGKSEAQDQDQTLHGR